MFKIQTLNNIAAIGLEQLPRDSYEVASEIQHPDAILLRSFNMHSMELPATVKAVARAGAGVNNIPISKFTAQGIPVFNTPGANANAVKELVLTGMLLASRNICQSWEYTRKLTGDDHSIHEQVEKNKKNFVGFELAGRTLGVIGLGAIGVKVANAAIALGMQVIGYDPTITVQRAWELSAMVKKANSIDEVLSRSDYVTFHVPLTPDTENMINSSRLHILKPNAVILNFARGGIIDEGVLLQALNENKICAYVCDFPNSKLLANPKVIALPHLGASTHEAEENCAVMACKQLREFLEDGNITNSVNFPEVVMPRNGGYRLAIANANIPNMVGQISTKLASVKLNIIDLLNKSRGEVAYTLIDLNQEVPNHILDDIRQIEGVLSVRAL
ncbi:MAG: phosphoglycerate dehydrogenase [Coxiellaceae bacterium]|nr:MAG: phosphoglycerate dehydrogenase [Coxiellaceae bacterium]